MASPSSWLSPDVMQALGWALVHSLWQGLAAAALAAVLMAVCRRASVRYLIAVGALVVVLAAPVATLLALLKSETPVQRFLPVIPGIPVAALSAAPQNVRAAPVAAPSITEAPVAAVASQIFAPPSQNFLPWLVGAWLLGVTLFGLRFAGGFLLLQHRRRHQSAAPSARILALCRDVERQLGITRAIRYLECGWLETPAVIGWLRPVILLPVSALSGLSQEQLRAIIAHELAHIRRLDAFVNLFQILAETLLFYHPAMWWLNRRIRAERELCCDEIAVSLTGDRLEYASALALMAEWKAAPVLAMAANRGPLPQRILHVLGRKPANAGQRMLGLAGGLVFLAATLGAANALLGIAAPIPVAEAKETFTAALSEVRKAFPASAPVTVERSDAAVAEAPPSGLPVPARRVLAHDMEIRTLGTQMAALAAPLIMATTASAQPVVEPRDDTVDNVVVTAPRLRPEKALDNFIIAHARTARPDGKIARWKSGICPVTVGFPAQFNRYIHQRIIKVAMAAGAPLASEEPCRSNLLVVATPQPQALLDEIRAKHPSALGFHYRSKAAKVATMTLPIQAWYGTVTEDFRGWIFPDYPSMPLGFEGANMLPTSRLLPDGMSVSGNRTGDGVKSLFSFALIIVDSSKIAGQEIGPISDYIAMLALSQGQYYDVCQDIPSITNLLAANCAPEMKPVALTDIDVTYLRGLYRMNAGLSYVGQRGSIAFNMKKTLGGY